MCRNKAGLVDEMILENVLGVTKTMLAWPVYRALWKRSRLTYAPEWMAYIDKLIRETPLAPPIDLVAQFQGHLAEVAR